MSGTCDVPVSKVRDYLLNPAHEHGGPKSAFFEAHGFERGRHEILAAALIDHFESNTPSEIFDTPFGRKYLVLGRLKTPDGRRPVIQAVWIVLTGETIPIFVTAVPRKPSSEAG